MLKLSLYNHLFQKNDKFYLYNSQQGFFAEIPEDIYISLIDRNFSTIDPETMDFLKSKDLIMEENDCHNFYQEEKIRFLKNAYNTENLNLVIVPYTGCNFNCPYCFESKRNPQMMEEGFGTKIVDFIKTHKNVKTMNVTWYGGEPLLAIDRIKEINNLLTQIEGITLTATTLVTNGYCVNDHTLSILKSLNLTQIQVTVDGNKETHDKTRALKADGTGTFEIVCENIKRLAENLPECEISVRVNINRKNKEDYLIVSKMFESSGLKNIFCYPGYIRVETPDGCTMCNDTISGYSKAQFILDMKHNGCRMPVFPNIKGKGCMMNTLQSYIIGPVGEIYKCWNDVSNEDRIIGNIADNDIHNRKLYYRYLNDTTVFSDAKCKDCKLFPVCDGGCGYYRYKNNFESGRFNLCHPFASSDRLLEQALLTKLEN